MLVLSNPLTVKTLLCWFTAVCYTLTVPQSKIHIMKNNLLALPLLLSVLPQSKYEMEVMLKMIWIDPASLPGHILSRCLKWEIEDTRLVQRLRVHRAEK